MDYGLTDRAMALRREVRRFVEDDLSPVAAEIDREDRYPAAVLEALGEHGYAGLTIDDAYGGGGGSMLELTVLIEELSRANMAVASAVGLNLGVAEAIERFGTDDQREAYLPGMARLETVGALGLSEAGAGSDKSGMETTAERDDDGWVIDGRKRWVTNFANADVVLTYARTGGEWPRGVTAFLVPAEAFDVETRWDTLGARGVETAAVAIDGVRVPETAVVGEVGEAMVQRGQLRTGINVPARAVGIAQAAFEDAREFAGQREQFGGPLTDKQGLRWQLAEMAERVDTSRLLVRRAASRADAGEDTARAASMAKVHATEAAVANANDAMQVHGGAGYVSDADVGRYLRDARLLTVAGGPNEVHRDSLADALL
jgi:alkylation response protein AidB-like acyl-CoA dehydrogenase